MEHLPIPSAGQLLIRLGVTENYKGFQYAAYAICICAEEQDRLLLVTKRLYPDVAKRFGTTWPAVERDLRTVIDVAWKHNSGLLTYLSQSTLEKKPPCARFLSILSRCLHSQSMPLFWALPDGDFSQVP